MNQLRTNVSVSLGVGRSVIIDYQYSRASMNLLQQVDWNDIDSIKEHYKDLPRSINNIPKHLLGISTEFGTVDKAIKWFSGLNATDQRTQAEYWKALPRPMKVLYKNNINILIQQKTIITSSVAAAAVAEATAQGKNKRGRLHGSKNKISRKKKSNTGDNVIASVVSPGLNTDNNNNKNVMTTGTPVSTRHSLTGTPSSASTTDTPSSIINTSTSISNR